MDLNAIINEASANYRPTPGDLTISEWNGADPINDVPPEDVVRSLHDESGRCWYVDAGQLKRRARVVLLRAESLDVCCYLQHTDPNTNKALVTDAEVEAASAYLRDKVVSDLLQNPPRLRQTIAGALHTRLTRQLPVEIANARARIETIISEISQRLWSARWLEEADHRVWAMLHERSTEALAGSITREEFRELHELAPIAGGWPMDRGSWVPAAHWVLMHEEWLAKNSEPDVL
jgi:hypothetical protein